MNGLCLALGLTLIWPQVATFTSVEEARAAIDDGESLQGRVAPALGRSAVSRISPGLTGDEELRSLVRVARAGRADAQLAKALLDVVAAGGPGVVAALDEFSILDDRARRLAQSGLWSRPENELRTLEYTLWQQAEGEAERPGEAAIALLAPRVKSRDIVYRLQRWSDDEPLRGRGRKLLEVLGKQAADPKSLLVELGRLAELPGLEEEAAACLRRLVIRSPEAAQASVQLAQLGSRGPGAALIRALGALPPSEWEEAERVLSPLLEASGAVQAAAIASAAELRLPAVAWIASTLLGPNAGGEPEPVQVAAAEALAVVGYPDAPTIDLLIGLLAHEALSVRRAAYQSLTKLSGIDLPGTVPVWQRWRKSVELPSQPPTEIEERLAADRELRKRMWQVWYGAR